MEAHSVLVAFPHFRVAFLFLKHAKIGLETKDYPKFATYLSKSQAIIGELMTTLDFEKGGEIAKDLDKIYEFCLFYLTEANIEKNTEKVERVIAIIQKIASAYKDIVETNTSVETDETIDAANREAGIRIAL